MVYCVNSLRTGCSLCQLYAHSGLWCQVLRDIDGMTDRLLALWWHLSLICFFLNAITCVLIRQRYDVDRGGEGDVFMEAEVGVMGPQAKEYQQL